MTNNIEIYDYQRMRREGCFKEFLSAAYSASATRRIDTNVLKVLCSDDVYGQALRSSQLSAKDCLFLASFVASLNHDLYFFEYKDSEIIKCLGDKEMIDKHKSALTYYSKYCLDASLTSAEKLRYLCTYTVIKSIKPLFQIAISARELSYKSITTAASQLRRALELGVNPSELKGHFDKFYLYYLDTFSSVKEAPCSYEEAYLRGGWRDVIESQGECESAREINRIAELPTESLKNLSFGVDILNTESLYPYLEPAAVSRVLKGINLEFESSSITLNLLAAITSKASVDSGLYQKAFRPDLVDTLVGIYVRSLDAAFLQGISMYNCTLTFPEASKCSHEVASQIRGRVAEQIALNSHKYERLVLNNIEFDEKNCETIGRLMQEGGHEQALVNLCSNISRQRNKKGFEQLLPPLLRKVPKERIADRKLYLLVQKLTINNDFEL